MTHWPRAVSRLLVRAPITYASLTDAERTIATRLYRLHPQPHKPTVGVGASPTPAPTVPHNVEVSGEPDQ